jgi:hypothetical protein
MKGQGGQKKKAPDLYDDRGFRLRLPAGLGRGMGDSPAGLCAVFRAWLRGLPLRKFVAPSGQPVHLEAAEGQNKQRTKSTDFARIEPSCSRAVPC